MEYESLWKMKPDEQKIIMELVSFLNEKLPNQESLIARYKLFEKSKELQAEFNKRLVEKGYIRI
jgi:transcription-repair coupling factor (superfamily II helicase)